MRSFPLSLQLLLRSDRIIVGTAACWLLSVGIGAPWRPEPVLDARRLTTSLAQVDAYMAGEPQRPVPSAPGGLAAALHRSLGAGEVGVQGLPAWSLHRRPQLLYRVSPAPPPPSFLHAPSRVTALEVHRGRIVVSWEPGEASRFLVVHYELWRRGGGEAWRALATVRPGEAYTDEDVAAESEYCYRLVSTAAIDPSDDEAPDPELAPLPPQVRRVEGPPAPPCTTPVELALSVEAVAPGDPLVGRPGSAQLTVYRWDRRAERFGRRSFLVQEGQPIGADAFTTGWTLRRVWVELREHPRGPAFRQPVGCIAFGEEGGESRLATDREPFRP